MTTYFYNNRQLLILCLIVTIVSGFSAFIGLPRLEDPRISNRNSQIITKLPGATAERVETLVTKKIETALRDLSEIKTIESTSSANVSIISVELDDLIYDTQRVVTKIRDKITDVQNELPAEASFPEVDDERGAVAFSAIYGITWHGKAPESHLNLMNRTAEELADRLRNVAGTDLVRIYGQPQEEIIVQLDRDRITELGLSPTEVGDRIRDADAKIAAGAVRSSASELVMEVEGAFKTVDRIRGIPLVNGLGGEVVRVGDVASVERSQLDPPEEIAFADSERAIFVAARIEDDQKLTSWVKSVRAAVSLFDATVSEQVQIQPVFEQDPYTRERLSGLGVNLFLGSLVVVIVILFMMGWRSAILVGVALPIVCSLVLFSLLLLGIPLHQMSIFGLIVAIGLLIDNAIVVVDDVTHQLRMGQSPTAAIDRTVRHLFVPLLGSTLTTVLSFLPIFLLPGNVGEFVGTIATTVILALVFSFLVSMTLIPSLTAIFAKVSNRQGWWENGIKASRVVVEINRFLHLVVRRPVVGVLFAMSIPLIGFLRVGELRNQFFPGADRNQFQVQVWTPPTSSVKATAGVSQDIEQLIRSDSRTKRVDWLIGGSMPTVYYNLVMTKEDTPNYAQAVVTTRESNGGLEMIESLQSRLDENFPESQIIVRQLSQGPPVNAPIEIRLYGPSTKKLRELGNHIRLLLSQTPGVIHTRSTFDSSRSKVMIQPNEAEARLAGLTLRDIANQLQAGLEGAHGGLLLESTEQLPVRIRVGNEVRGDLDEIASSRLQVGSGSSGVERRVPWMPLESVAELHLVPEVTTIPRRNGERCNTIQAFVRADLLPPEVTDDFLRKLERSHLAIPTGYRLQVGGDSEELRNSMSNLFAYAPILGVLIFATLILTFRSFAFASVIGLVAGLSVGIAFFSVWVAGFPLGFNPLIGMAGLIGLAINDSIVVLTQIRSSSAARDGDLSAIVAEVMKTGRHLISTTLTTIGGFVPLLVGGGTFWPPLAMVIAGGVGGATILAAVLVPCVYVWIGPRVEKSRLSASDRSTTSRQENHVVATMEFAT